MERLSGEFNRGYTRAIMDIQAIFSYVQPDLLHHKKRLTPKLMGELLSCCLDKWNGKSEKFEFYE